MRNRAKQAGGKHRSVTSGTATEWRGKREGGGVSQGHSGNYRGFAASLTLESEGRGEGTEA